jgi:hypothetical protein
VTSLFQSAGKPFETFVQTISRGGASGLDVLRVMLANTLLLMTVIDIPKHVVEGCEGQAYQ